ncbi:hypothetical protein HOG98_10115 [bacterium]|nr:hypothetical protein [bacterium]
MDSLYSDQFQSNEKIQSGYNPDFFKPNKMSESIYRLLDQLDVDPSIVKDIKSSFGNQISNQVNQSESSNSNNSGSNGFYI